MTARTRAAKKTAETTTTPAKKTATTRPARKRIPRKTTAGAPKLSLVKALKPLPTRDLPFMTDVQGYATLACRMVGIPTLRIRDWRDHRDNTATRRLHDGSTLHYDLNTRTLTWQAVCPMGAVHAYVLASPSLAAAARVHADLCREPHADLSTVKALTADELESLGLLQTPTWARPDLIGDDFTDTKPIPAEPVIRATASAAQTQPMSLQEIADGIAARAATAETETAKEHPQP